MEQELARKALAARAEVASLNNQLELLLARAEGETAALGPGHRPVFRTGRTPRRSWPGWRPVPPPPRGNGTRPRRSRGIQAWTRGGLEAATARAARQPNSLPGNDGCPTPRPPRPSSPPKSEQLGLHRKAEVLGGQLQAAESAEAAEALASQAMAEAAAELRAAALTDPELTGLDEPRPDADAARRRCAHRRHGAAEQLWDACARVRAVLEERLPDESRLAELTARAGQLRGSLEQFTAERRSGAAALEALRAETAGLLAGLRPLEELAAEVQLRAKEAAAAEELVALVGRYAAAEAACAGVAERHRRARDEHQDRRQRWLDLREERLANAAGELAAQLSPAPPVRCAGARTIRYPPRQRRQHWPWPRPEKTAQEASEAAEVDAVRA